MSLLSQHRHFNQVVASSSTGLPRHRTASDVAQRQGLDPKYRLKSPTSTKQSLVSSGKKDVVPVALPTSSPSLFVSAFATPLPDKTQVAQQLIREMQEIGHDPFSLRPVQVAGRNANGSPWWTNYDFSYQFKNPEIPKLSGQQMEDMLKYN